jgi:hypothetical protein
MMNPSTCGFVRFEMKALDLGRWRSPRISRISPDHEGFDEGFDEPCRSSWSK